MKVKKISLKKNLKKQKIETSKPSKPSTKPSIMNVLDCIKTRKSVRFFSSKKVEWEKIVTMIEAGIQAPSAGNLQPWYFVILETNKEKNFLYKACMEQSWIKECSHIIAVIADVKKTEYYYPGNGRDYAIESCSACVENMLLAAHALGLGTVWIGAFDKELVHNYLEIPKGLEVMAFICVGYPSQAAIAEQKRARIEPASKTFYHKFGNQVRKPWRTWYAFNNDVQELKASIHAKLLKILNKFRKTPLEQVKELLDNNVYNSIIEVLEDGKQKVLRLGLKRQPGFLYFIDKDGDIARVPVGKHLKDQEKSQDQNQDAL